MLEIETIFIITNIIKISLFDFVFYVPIIIFQSCRDRAYASPTPNQCYGSLLEA